MAKYASAARERENVSRVNQQEQDKMYMTWLCDKNSKIETQEQ